VVDFAWHIYTQYIYIYHTWIFCGTHANKCHENTYIFRCFVQWTVRFVARKLRHGVATSCRLLRTYVSFVGYRLFDRALAQKRPRILRSLPIVATPYRLENLTSSSLQTQVSRSFFEKRVILEYPEPDPYNASVREKKSHCHFALFFEI